MTRRAEITVTINDQTVMSWFSLIVKDVARGVEPHVMWWLGRKISIFDERSDAMKSICH